MITCGSGAEARKIAKLLVKTHQAACVNIIPVRSIFEWQGKIEDQGEWLLLIKSVKSHFEKIEALVRANHSYDLPEIIAIDIESVSSAYSDWVRRVCGKEL
jgi:periplasmic divalent cation tolerance protein